MGIVTTGIFDQRGGQNDNNNNQTFNNKGKGGVRNHNYSGHGKKWRNNKGGNNRNN